MIKTKASKNIEIKRVNPIFTTSGDEQFRKMRVHAKMKNATIECTPMDNAICNRQKIASAILFYLFDTLGIIPGLNLLLHHIYAPSFFLNSSSLHQSNADACAAFLIQYSHWRENNRMKQSQNRESKKQITSFTE